MKKNLLLLALASIAASAADKPFSLLEEVSADPYAEVANRIEYQNMVLLPDYTVIARHYYLAPMRLWIAWVKQGDSAARDWNGTRKTISGRNVGIDLVELWADTDNRRAAALVMSEIPVDNKGNYLLAWLDLLPAQVRQNSGDTLRVMMQALAEGDSARVAALMHIPETVAHKTAWREALQQCLTAHLPQIRDSHPQRRGRRKPGDGRDSGIMLRMNVDGKDRAVILPLQKDKDGYAFVLDTEAFSQCKNLPE